MSVPRQTQPACDVEQRLFHKVGNEPRIRAVVENRGVPTAKNLDLPRLLVSGSAPASGSAVTELAIPALLLRAPEARWSQLVHIYVPHGPTVAFSGRDLSILCPYHTAVLSHDVLADAEYGRHDLQRVAGIRTTMGAPMILDNEVVAVLTDSRRLEGQLREALADAAEQDVHQGQLELDDVAADVAHRVHGVPVAADLAIP